MQGLIIKELEMRDLDTVYEIEAESYNAPWSRNFFRLMAHTSPELFLTALIDEEIIGYTVGEVDTRPNGTRLGHVMNLAVKETFRNKGVGSALMDELELRFREMGAKTAYLEVRESNKTAQKLYSDRGYSFFKKAKDYYGDEDGFVMTKAIN